MSCLFDRRDQDPLNEPLSDFLAAEGLSPTADDVKGWRGAESAARFFMEPLSRESIVFREAAGRPHVPSVEICVPPA